MFDIVRDDEQAAPTENPTMPSDWAGESAMGQDEDDSAIQVTQTRLCIL